MLITVNGAAVELACSTVAELLVNRMDDPRPHGVAVAVNGAVVPRDSWPRWPLAAGDVVEVVTAVAGG